jgi:predicted DNA binding CopG/RHH family protein
MAKTKTEIDEIDEIDLTKLDWSKAKKNPYAKLLNKQVTINLSVDVIDYFKRQSARSGIPYQTLINCYLMDCAANDKLKIPWLDGNN